MTDAITFLLSFYFLIRGASRGFVPSLLIPLSIILATVISIIYFQITKDWVLTLIFGLVGPVLLNLLFSYLLKIWARTTNTEIKPNLLSRLGGAVVTLCWGWVFIIFALILIAAFPPWGNVMTWVHNDVTKSASYFFAKPWGDKLFAAATQNAPAATGSTPSNNAASLAQDPRFQKIMQDPEIQKEVDAHDIAKLISNPKMIALTQQILADPAAMKKIMSIYNSQTQAQ